jgi:hypothetical protein
MHGRRLNSFRCWFISGASAALAVVMVHGATRTWAAEAKVETILSDLRAPCCVAVRPDSNSAPAEIFVADRAAGRVIQVHAETPNAGDEAIAGFPVAEAADSSGCAVGVRSLCFLDGARLVTAGTGQDGTPFLRLFDFLDGDNSLQADDFKQDVEFSNGADANGRLCVEHIARTSPNDRVADMLIIASSNERGALGLLKIPVRANTLADATALKPTAGNADIGAAQGIAIGRSGFIVVSCKSKTEGTTQLKYVNPLDGRVSLALDVRLGNVVALAYHPKTGNLYACNQAAADAGGGIYRIDDATEPSKPAVSAVKLADAPRPTALAFGRDGALYVTALGNGNSDGPSGSLLKLTGEL